ncbi:MAG: glycosyltransferase family 39 protein, partial [Actinomycetota bacterium]|nr:glycosyltransferase family 39 protein [Actinomycetota bacterium]
MPTSARAAAPRRPAVSSALLWLASFTVAAAVLRFSTLGVQSYWYNEAATVVLVKLGFGDMLSRIPRMEGNPPLYYVLAWVWARVFGAGEVGMRSLSALAGTAMVPAVYAAGARLGGRRTGLAIAALAAFSPLLVWFSQEARPYILLSLLTAVAFVFFLRALEDDRRRDVAWWAGLSMLALATHYFALLVIAPQALWLLWRCRRRGPILIGSAAILAVAAALLPLALDQREPAKTSIPGSLGTRIVELPKQLLLAFNGVAERPLAVLAAALVALGAWLAWRRGEPELRRAALLAAGLGATAICVVVAAAAAGIDYLNTRNMIEAWLLLLLVPAIGFAAPGAGRVGLAALGILCAIGLLVVVSVDVHRPYQRDDWRGAVHALGRAHGTRAVIVTPANGVLPLQVYLPRAKPLPPSGAVVSEIDLLGVARRVREGQQPQPPRPAAFYFPPPFR